MWETALVAFTTFFVTIGPMDVSALFVALTSKNTPTERRRIAFKGVIMATGILMSFALFGQALLDWLGISLAALRTAGGILLMLLSIEMVFARHSGGTSTTQDENLEAQQREDISVFPLATPLIAGPGAMGAVVLLVADTQGDWGLRLTVIGALLLVLGITLLLLIMATGVQKFLGTTGTNVLTRIFGVLLSALAVQFIFDGLSGSGLFQ